MTTHPPFQEIDHTADVGLKIYGDNLSELFLHAAQGLFSLICEDEFPWDNRKRSSNSVQIRLHSDSLEELFHDWLGELLYFHSTRKIIFTQYEIATVSSTAIKATAYGKNYDENDIQHLQEIKAVTYHQLEVKETPAGYESQVIFDI